MARFFTLQQAERLLRTVEPALKTVIASKVRLDEAQFKIRELSQRITLSGGMIPNQELAAGLQRELAEAAGTAKQAFESVQETGCVIKDLELGLLDFPTLYRGEEVYLCWKLGEDRIQYWHGVDEGFRGRKEIDDDFLKNHRGDA